MTKNQKKKLIEAVATFLAVTAVAVLFMAFGFWMKPEGYNRQLTMLDFASSMLYLIALPVLGYLLGYRNKIGCFYGLGACVGCCLLPMGFYLYFAPIAAVAAQLEQLVGFQLSFGIPLFILHMVITAGLFLLGRVVRRGGLGMRMPGEH